MKKINFLVLLLVIVLGASSSAYAQSNDMTFSGKTVSINKLSNPVDFSLDNGTLSIDKILINEKSILEISPYDSKSKLFEGSLAEYDQIEIDEGNYLVVITDSSDDLITLYHGIMSVNQSEILLSMDSYQATTEDLLRTKITSPMAVGTVWEVEPNNTLEIAMLIYNDYDVFGRIYDSNDIDWYKVKFPSSGSANIWLGNIPSGEDFDLDFYNESGTRIGRSQSSGSQELITLNVSANTWYYIKVYGYNGSSSASNYLLRAKVYSSYAGMGWKYFFADTSINNISSPYGMRNGVHHNGIDVTKSSGSILGTEILSVTSGTVARRYLNVPSPKPNWSMGYAISIKTNNTDPETENYLHTLYMHMRDEPLPDAVGDSVAKGEKIGYVGNTGQSSGAHLHFQVTKNGSAWADGAANNVNPVYFFSSILPQSFADESYALSDEYSDTLIPLELVDYVGLDNFKDWIITQKKAPTIPLKFDINEFREYFHIIDSEFIKLIHTNNMEDMYDTKEIINEKSIL